MRVYCKSPLTLDMWYITALETMTDCNMSCVRHTIFTFFGHMDTRNNFLYGLHNYDITWYAWE